MLIDSLKPLNDLIVIRRIVEEEPRSPSGILLPPTEESANTPYRGIVVAAGPGKPAKLSGAGSDVVNALKALLDAFNRTPSIVASESPGINLAHWKRAADAIKAHAPFPRRILMTVQVGDTVIYSRNGYQTFRLDNEEFVVMGEASIMGIIEGQTCA